MGIIIFESFESFEYLMARESNGSGVCTKYLFFLTLNYSHYRDLYLAEGEI